MSQLIASLSICQYRKRIETIVSMSSETVATRSFLGLEGLHVFVTGAAGGIGRCAVQEFLGRSQTVYLSSGLITSFPLTP